MTKRELSSDGRPSTVTLNTVEFRRLCKANGLNNDRAIAAALGIQHSTAWRTGTGTTGPSERFIAGCLRAFPNSSFEDLFSVVDYQKGEGRTA